VPIGVPLYSALHRQNGIITIKMHVSTPLSQQCVILRRVPYAKCPFLGLTLTTGVVSKTLTKDIQSNSLKKASVDGILKAAFWRTTEATGLLPAESFRKETHVVGVFLQKFFFSEAQFREFNRHRQVIVCPFVAQRVFADI
jgi:hypothetical protein